MGWSLRTRIALSMIGVSILLGLNVHVMAQGQTLYVQSSKANVRMSPDRTTGSILAVLPRGIPVTADALEGEWHPVQLEDGRQGWMHRSVLAAEQPRIPVVAATAGLRLLRIGVVLDGPRLTRDFFPVFDQEIRDLLRGECAVRFPAAKRLTADYTRAGVRQAMSRLLADSQVDMVLALGVLASNDAYRRGVVSILDLLDAQTEALNARLDAANSVYVYLIDLMEVQRAVGQFDFFLSDTGRKAWFDKLDAFFRQQGATPKP